MTCQRRLYYLLIIVLVVAMGLILNFHKDLIQQYNIRTMMAHQLDGRLVVHRVNDLNKLGQILDDGITSLEIDLWFDTANNHFIIGHDADSRSGLTLDSMLHIIHTAGPAHKIWLDIKNLSDTNLDATLSELERLDSLFAIKSIAIVESGITSDSFRRVAEAGFHTSYYLPTAVIREWGEGDQTQRKAHFASLAAQIKRQQVAAVSFDLIIYDQVKQLLEPLLDSSIVYHTWGSHKMWEWGAIKRIDNTIYFTDPRVETILYRYWN